MKGVDDMEFGDKIKMLRIKQGLTLEEVGERVGVGKSTVRKWENGQIANMRRDKIALVARALNVSPAYLMGWDDASPTYGDERSIWTQRFTEATSAMLAEYDQADCEAAGVNLQQIGSAIEKGSSLRFDEACDIADQLDISIDEVVMQREKPTLSGELSEELTAEEAEFISIFIRLTPENRRLLLANAKVYLQAQGDSTGSQG